MITIVCLILFSLLVCRLSFQSIAMVMPVRMLHFITLRKLVHAINRDFSSLKMKFDIFSNFSSKTKIVGSR